MMDLLAWLVDALLRISFLTCAAAVVTIALFSPPRWVSWLGAAALEAFLGLGLLAVSIRIGWRPVPVLTVALIAVVAAVFLVEAARRGKAWFAFTLGWFSLLGLGALWSARLGAAGAAMAWKPLALMIVAVLCLVAAAKWRRLSRLLLRVPPLLLFFAGLGLLALPLLTRNETNGAYIGVDMPMVGEIQVGDLGRLLLLLWLARAVARDQQAFLLAGSRWSWLRVRKMAVIALPTLLGVAIGAVSSDFGPVVVLALTTFAVVAVGGLGRRYLVLVAALAVGGTAFLSLLERKVLGRWSDMLQPIPAAPEDITQVGRGLILMAHGAVGLGEGLPTLVPLSSSDMVLAAIGHELGYTTLIALMLVYSGILAAMGAVLARISDSAERIAAAALTVMLIVPGLMMLAAVLTVAPLTGMPVPLVATSGSSLVVSCLAVGLLLTWGTPAETVPIGRRTGKRFNLLITIPVGVLLLAIFGRALFLSVTKPAVLEAAGARDQFANRTAGLALPEVLTADGKSLAVTVTIDGRNVRLGNAERVHTGGPAFGGEDGIPALDAAVAANSACTGLSGPKAVGCAPVRTTLDSRVQEVAYKAMGKRLGSVVAIDTVTGDVLAYVTTQASGQPEDLIRQRTAAPGSLAKVLTAAAALESRVDTTIPPVLTYQVASGKFDALHSLPCGGELGQAMAQSCNPYFAALGAEVGGTRLAQLTDGWLNGQTKIDGLPIAQSHLVRAENLSPYMVSAGAIGLGDAQVTSLSMVGVMGMVARGGNPVCLHLLAGSRNACPDQKGMSKETAAAVSDAMRQVVREGTAKSVSGLTRMDAAAKTGTADLPGFTNATFGAFAPASRPRVAVVVFIDSKVPAGGARDAGPVAAAVLGAALDVVPA